MTTMPPLPRHRPAARCTGLVALVLLALSWRPTARASEVLPLGLDALCDHSAAIVRARVESRESRWTRDRSAIYTDVTLRVLDAMKGGARPGDTLKVRRLGGSVDGMGMKVFGEASYAPGEEVVVFLERRGGPRGGTGDVLWTVGMAQGKLRVATVDGQAMALRDLAGLSLLRAPSSQGSSPAPSTEPRSRIPLDELLQTVRERVRVHPHAP